MLAAILLVAVVLRIETISAHLSNDEGYSYLVGSAPSVGSFLHRLSAYENTPPLFYALLAPLALAHTASLRVPAAIPGVLIALVLYLALRRGLGVRAGLLAAAIVAVAPYHVSYSDYSRGFMLEGLGCMLTFWAMLRLFDGAGPRWWLLYLAGGALALYSEYFAAVFLAGLTFAALLFSPRGRTGALPRRLRALRLRIGALGLLPLASLLPWIGQIERAQDALHHTKVLPVAPSPSPGTLRELIVRLALGEHGAGSSAGVRWLELLALAALLGTAALHLRRRSTGEAGNPAGGAELATSSARRAGLLAGTTGALVLIGHALVTVFGVEIFNQRYLTVLIPLGATLIAAAVSQLRVQWPWIAAMAGTAVVAVAVFAQRYQRQYEPDLAPVRAAAAGTHPRTVLTNSAVVAYYLRGLHPVLDRPFGLDPGLERSCTAPCVIVDDSRIAGGVRPGPGPSQRIGFFQVRLVTGGRRGAEALRVGGAGAWRVGGAGAWRVGGS